MDEVYAFLADVADYAEKRLRDDPALMIVVTTRTSEGDKPGALRNIDGDLVLCITLQDPPR
jgi:hypothetical protein